MFAMPRGRAFCGVLVASLLLPLESSAQKPTPTPKFEFTKEEEAKKLQKLEKVEWKASASAGLIITTGNSETTTISGTANASRQDKNNKVQVIAAGAFAKSRLFIANDLDGSGSIDGFDEITEAEQTTTEQWLITGRYDRFFTAKNSVFAAAGAGANEPAGKQFIGNGQLGYAREIVKDETHSVSGEVGYDYTYENLDAQDNNDLSIHSFRGFLGYTGKVSKETQVAASGEILVNLNEVELPTRTAAIGEDTRFNGLTSLTTKLWEDISFRFAFTILYDNAPAPRPAFGIPYGNGFLPEADQVDTKTEASIIINFL